MMNIQTIRAEFPILDRTVYNKPLIYFDNAATTQKPKSVIEALTGYYQSENSNVHRGVHYLSQKATDAFEHCREQIREFIHAAHSREIIFTRGTTEGINLVASSFSKAFLSQGDEIIVSEMEHHSNLVPWQMACQDKGAFVKVLTFDENGILNLDDLDSLITDKTKLIAVNHVSNTLGTINPIKEIIARAHHYHIPVLIDGAQAISHIVVDVQDLDCDFYCFSGHKMYAPMGVGVVYGKEKLLNQMPPYQGGGEMIKNVSFKGTTYNELPFKFEAGTPSVGDVVAFEEAVNFIKRIGIRQIADYEMQLYRYAMAKMSCIPQIRFFGMSEHKVAIISFLVGKIHPYDMGMILDKMGIAVRTGHHCTQPIMEHFGIPGTVRVSFAVYNTEEEIDYFVESLKKAVDILK